MILSNYTFLFEHNEEYFMFNSLSRAFIEIDKDSFQLLLDRQKNKSKISKEQLDKELYEELEKH